MKIVIAPDSFKGTLTANEVANIIKDSMHRVYQKSGIDAEIITIPIADGGEGTSSVLLENLGGIRITRTVTGPEGDAVEASYVIIDHEVAVIEVAESSGLKDCHNMDTKKTSTYGLGELILDALDHDVKEIIVCLGGSGTTDGGAGMAAALGATFKIDQQIVEIPTGEILHQLSDIEIERMDPRIAKTSFKILTDVNNPLYGIKGAAYIYGPQKGASPDDLKLLDDGLKNYARLLNDLFQKDCATFLGAGAAGGLGSGCHAFLNAQVLPGIETLLKMINFDDVIKDASVIITGEGKLDEQSFMGKAISGIINHSNGKPVILICGDNACSKDCLFEKKIEVFAATDFFSKEQSLAQPIQSLERVSEVCSLHIFEAFKKVI